MMTNGKGKLAGLVGATVFCILAAVPIQAQTSQQGITGTWLNLGELLLEGMVWEFTGNRLMFDGQVVAEYRLDANAGMLDLLNFVGGAPDARLGYEIRNIDTLILTEPGSKEPFEFKRAKNDPALYGGWFIGGRMFEFTEDNRLIILEDGDSEEVGYAVGENRIVSFGRGSSNEFRYEIRNGSLFLDGDEWKKVSSAPVTALSGKYNLVNDEGYIQTIEFLDRTRVRLRIQFIGAATKTGSYTLSGTNLTMTVDGFEFLFEIALGGMMLKGIETDGLSDDSVFIKE